LQVLDREPKTRESGVEKNIMTETKEKGRPDQKRMHSTRKKVTVKKPHEKRTKKIRKGYPWETRWRNISLQRDHEARQRRSHNQKDKKGCVRTNKKRGGGGGEKTSLHTTEKREKKKGEKILQIPLLRGVIKKNVTQREKKSKEKENISLRKHSSWKKVHRERRGGGIPGGTSSNHS